MFVVGFVKRVSIVVILAFLLQSCATEKVIRVSSQEDLDELNQKLSESLVNGGKKVKVKFKKGTYYYDGNCINLSQINSPNTHCVIDGSGSLLIPKGSDYKNGEVFKSGFNPGISIVNVNTETDVSYWENVRYSESRIELVDKEKDLWRLKCSSLNDITKNNCKNIYILLTSWYRAFVLKVDHVKDGYLYFISDNREFNENRQCYALDGDYGFGKRYPRFKICNYVGDASFQIKSDGLVDFKKSLETVHVCKAGSFLKLDNCYFRGFRIKGFQFLGASAKSDQPSLIELNKTKSNSIEIVANSFVGMQNKVISISGTDNVWVKDNTFKDCYKTGVTVNNSSTGSRIIHNTFSRCGLKMGLDYAVYITGGDYLVSNNTISDFGYSAIRVGVWRGSTATFPSYGVIEYNEIYYSPDCYQDIENYGLMDAGAIYVATQNEGAVIRYNYIHDIDGACYNRGVFCDDGARCFSIYGNIITNIANSYCIDSRRVSVYEKELGPTNIGNVVRDNILDGNILFAVNPSKDNRCELGTNYFLIKDNIPFNNNEYKNSTATGNEIHLSCDSTKNGVIYIHDEDYKILKNSPSWIFFKSKVKRVL